MTPFILGTGGTMPLEGEVDLTELDGLVTASAWVDLCRAVPPSDRDLYYLNQLEAIQMILPQNRLSQVWKPGSSFEGRIPDYLLVAARGFAFCTPDSSKKPLYRVNARDNAILYLLLINQSIVDIAPAIKNAYAKKSGSGGAGGHRP